MHARTQTSILHVSWVRAHNLFWLQLDQLGLRTQLFLHKRKPIIALMEELPFGLLRSGTPWLQALVVMPMLLFSGLHFYLTKSDVQGVLSRLCALCQEKPAVTQRELDKHQRFEQELLKARLEIWGMVQRVIIHLCFWVNLAAMHNLMLNPNQAAFMQMVGPVLGYAMNTAIQTGVVEIKTASQFRILEAVLAGIYAVDLFEVAHVTEFEVFCSMEKMSAVTMLLISVMFIDLKMTVPVYVSGALVLTYKQWQLLGFSRVTPMLMCSTLCSHCVTVVVVMFIVYAMQRHIAARLDSDDTSSLLLAFRRVLRGVCDGELVLDRRNHRIVEDASSLERLLNAKKKLSETSFLDLFLDSEGRQRFLEFLDSESSTKENRATIPPCLRIALQGASGPVSTDVFFTSCGAAGQEYYLLAFRADPEQFIAPPDAVADGHKAPWQNDQMNHLSPPPASSVEVAEAFKELVQVGMAEKGKRLLFSIVFNCSWKFNGRTEVSPFILNACSMLLCLSKSILRPCSRNHHGIYTKQLWNPSLWSVAYHFHAFPHIVLQWFEALRWLCWWTLTPLLWTSRKWHSRSSAWTRMACRPCVVSSGSMTGREWKTWWTVLRPLPMQKISKSTASPLHCSSGYLAANPVATFLPRTLLSA